MRSREEAKPSWLRRPVARRDILRVGGALNGVVLFGVACNAPVSTPSVTPTSQATAPTAGASGAPLGSPTAVGPRAKYGGTFRNASSTSPPHLDFHQTTNSRLAVNGAGMAYSRLVKFKTGVDIPQPSTIPTGDLAESWEQADELTYVFKLRRGVRFHNIPPVNGREFVAEDVVYSFNRQRTTGFPNASVLGSILRIEAPDRYGVKITLDKPDADFLVSLGSGYNKILAREAVELTGDLKQGPTIGTGPWILEKEEPDVGTSLVRNPDYFLKGLPYADRYEVVVIKDSSSIVSAFRSKQLDGQQVGVGFTRSDIEALRRTNPEVTEVRARSFIGNDLGLKCDSGPTKDLRVRQAIAKAIDRQQIIDTVYFGDAWFTAGVTLPALDYVLPEDELKRLYRRDVEGAKRLLAEAGYPNGFEIEFLFYNFSAAQQSVAELIAAQLKDVGIDARLKPLTGVQYNETVLAKGEYQMYLGTPQLAPSANADLLGRHHSKGSGHTFKLNDPQLDAMIERQAVMTRDPEGRKRALQEIQRYIIQQSHLLLIQAGIGAWIHWPWVKDFYIPGVSGAAEYDQFTRMWLDK